jgi:hypothetical protein
MVLAALGKKMLSAHLAECKFFTTHTEFLGMFISDKRITKKAKSLSALQDLRTIYVSL